MQYTNLFHDPRFFSFQETKEWSRSIVAKKQLLILPLIRKGKKIIIIKLTIRKGKMNAWKKKKKPFMYGAVPRFLNFQETAFQYPLYYLLVYFYLSLCLCKKMVIFHVFV